MTGISEWPIETLTVTIVVLLVIAACFAGAETGLTSLDRHRLRHLAKSGHRGARKAQRLLKRPERLLAALSFGNTLVKFTAAALGAALGMRFLGEDGVLLAPILIGLLFLLFADVAPKTLATQRPEAVAVTGAAAPGGGLHERAEPRPGAPLQFPCQRGCSSQ
jgi:Mg2+/Co2+ transporter CorB